MRDFSTLHGSRRTLTLKKFNPVPTDLCTDVNCGHRFSLHNMGVECILCFCLSFVVDTSKPPDEVVRVHEWHRQSDDALIEDPAEIAELERRLSAIGGA